MKIEGCTFSEFLHEREIRNVSQDEEERSFNVGRIVREITKASEKRVRCEKRMNGYSVCRLLRI